MENKIVIDGIYEHFKGNCYKVIASAKDANTLEDVVVYESMEDSTIWTRTLNDFFAKINPDREDNVSGQEYRFMIITK